MKPKSYRDLAVWQVAMDLVVMVYSASSTFPKSELFGLTQQLRRAAVSVPSNIAEGAERRGTKEFLQFVGIALGSLAEVCTLIQIAARLDYLAAENQSGVLEEIIRIESMLHSLRRALESKLQAPKPPNPT